MGKTCLVIAARMTVCEVFLLQFPTKAAGEEKMLSAALSQWQELFALQNE